MARVGNRVLTKVLEVLQAEESMTAAAGRIAMEEGLEQPVIAVEQIRALYAAPELLERSLATRYPCIHVYCERIANTLREKFRQFSGTATVTVEVRCSQDRLEGLEDQVRLFTDAVTEVLGSNRGDWGDGTFYPGGYAVTFGPVKQGGKGFLQIAKATFELEISY
jgi:hypothetical protein